MLKICLELAVISSLLFSNTALTMERGKLSMLYEKVGFDHQEYMNFLEELIGHSKSVQNNPQRNLIPKEILVANAVTRYLANLPGLTIKMHSYDQNGDRPNVIIRYKHKDAKTDGRTITFMGSHMDVVPADPLEWERDPFSLSRETLENDIKLHGRGTTDCLGHVALLSMMMKRLSQAEIKLKHEIAVVFIADEEVGQANVGVFRLHQDALLNDFKNGPIYWVDTATLDGLFGPRVGTAGIGRWSVTIKGKSGHSGYPQLCINPISISLELIRYINKRFKADFLSEKSHQYAKALFYPSGSTCKCTSFNSGGLGASIIPELSVFSGDVRFTPDIDATRIKDALQNYVEDYKTDIKTGKIKALGVDGGDYSTIDDGGQLLHVNIDFCWQSEQFSKPFAADINSLTFKNILQAMREVRGKAEPFSALGSLPLLYELQNEGYSLVPIGFGRQKAYHAPNEYCLLSEMHDGYKVMLLAIEMFEKN